MEFFENFISLQKTLYLFAGNPFSIFSEHMQLVYMNINQKKSSYE